MPRLDERYPDLLGQSSDPAAIALVDALDRAYSDTLSPERDTALTRTLQLGTRERGTRGSGSRLASRFRPVLVGIVALLLAGGAALATSNILNLGKPTNTLSTATYFPLSGFHRIPITLHTHDKPELLFIGTQVDAPSAVERWPVVKALEQFGTLANVRPDMSTFGGPGMPQAATFDLSHARYQSRYLAFAHVDLLGHNPARRPFQPLSGEARTLYTRYAREPKPLRDVSGRAVADPDHILATLANQNQPTSHRLPLVSVGGYLQTVSQVVVPGDFMSATLVNPATPTGYVRNTPLSFATVQNALIHQRDPAGTHLVEDVNAEANIVTALICHSDGNRPSAVCGRSTIKLILRHVGRS
jgi:hypothetical protein